MKGRVFFALLWFFCLVSVLEGSVASLLFPPFFFSFFPFLVSVY
jgi:hypothetical protein